jgi:DNA-binding response OmpR family regulator
MYTILLTEDDPIIASGLTYALEREGYAVTTCTTAAEAKTAIKQNTYNLAILDMQLPDGTGFDVRDALKNTGTAVIFLTVVDDEGHILRAFESGADDYITKPFRLRELTARVKRTLERPGGTASSTKLEIGTALIDTTAGKVYINGEPIELTALEYRLLLTFARHRGQMLTRGQILESLWDSAGQFVEDNTLTVYIKRLREKLGNAVKIETVRGQGYRVD